MPRDKSLDNIFLKNFFKNKISFFTREQPSTAETYLLGHGLATSDWYPLKAEIDSYPLSYNMKNNLNKLFELAEKYVYFACSEQPFRSSLMKQKWEEMRQIAKIIYQSAINMDLLK